MNDNRYPLQNRTHLCAETTARPIACRMRKLMKPLLCTMAGVVRCLLFIGSASANESGEFKKAKKELAAGNYETAEQIFRKLIEKDPSDPDPRLGLSLLFLKQHNLAGAYDEAIKVLKTD